MDGEGRYALFQAARPALLPTASAGFGGQFFKLPPSVRLRRTLDKKLCKKDSSAMLIGLSILRVSAC